MSVTHKCRRARTVGQRGRPRFDGVREALDQSTEAQDSRMKRAELLWVRGVPARWELRLLRESDEAVL